MAQRINMIMQSVFFKLANIIPVEDAIRYLKEAVVTSYGKKGEKVVNMNNAAIDAGVKAIVKIEDIVNELFTIAFTDRTKISKNVRNKILERKEDGTEVEYYEDNVIFAETDELDDKTKKIISGYKKTQSGFAVETYDKMKALELLGKYLGMFKDEAPTINNNIVNPYANLSEEELRKLVGD